MQYQFRHLGEIGEGRVMAEPSQVLARRGIAQFGLVAQCEQRLMAAGAGTGAGDRQHLVGVEIGGLAATRRMGEGAVMADVAAQLGQRDEDLARIGHEAAMPLIAQSRCDLHQRQKIGRVGERQGLRLGESSSSRSATQRILGQNVMGGHRRKPPAGGMRSPASTARARVGEPLRIKDTTSAGLSMSRPIPGSRSTVGRMPHSSAARRCG